MVEGLESVELLQSEDQGFRGRGVEVIEVDEIVDAQALKLQHNVTKVDLQLKVNVRGQRLWFTYNSSQAADDYPYHPSTVPRSWGGGQ